MFYEGGALLYLVLQRNFRLAASYGCFYLLLVLLLYDIRFHGPHMPVFSEFYVLMFWNLSPIFLVSWDLITTPPGMLSAFLSRLRMPTLFIFGLLVVFRFFPTMRMELKGVGRSMKNRGLTAAAIMRKEPGRGSHCGSRMCDSHGFLFGFGKEHGMIELTHASFQYENSDRGVQDISLSVKRGECVVLTGLSGCGKITVTRLVNGLAPSYYPGAFSGNVRIDGKDIARLSTWEIYYCGNDTSTQFFTASVAEELLLNTELTEESKDRARHLLKEFGLYEYRDAHPSSLSGGQKQRLAIACAIFSGRRILILDEPTSGLDGQNMRLVAERLKIEARSGRTILMITHDRELIESCCDKVVEVEKRSP